MGDVAAEQVVEPAAVDLLGRHRPGRRLALGEGLLCLLGQHEAAQAARGIGERRSHRVQAVEPDGAAGSFREVRAGGVVALAVGAVEVVARALAVLVVLVRAGLEGLALRTGAAVVGLAVRARRSAGLAGARIARWRPGSGRARHGRDVAGGRWAGREGRGGGEGPAAAAIGTSV